MATQDTDKSEREILRLFFDVISETGPQDNTVSDSKILKATQNKMKIALRGAEYRCTCAKMTWGCICETCQGSDEELVSLRNFYIQMRRAKKFNLTTEVIQQFIKNTREHLAA